MASIHQRSGTDKWHCSFRDSTGKWRFVSTKTADKAEAMAVCARLETLAKQSAPKAEDTVPAEHSGELLEAGLKLIQTAKAGALSESTARDYVNRVMKASGTEAEIAGESARDFFTNWLAGKEVGAAGHLPALPHHRGLVCGGTWQTGGTPALGCSCKGHRIL